MEILTILIALPVIVILYICLLLAHRDFNKIKSEKNLLEQEIKKINHSKATAIHDEFTSSITPPSSPTPKEHQLQLDLLKQQEQLKKDSQALCAKVTELQQKEVTLKEKEASVGKLRAALNEKEIRLVQEETRLKQESAELQQFITGMRSHESESQTLLHQLKEKHAAEIEQLTARYAFALEDEKQKLAAKLNRLQKEQEEQLAKERAKVETELENKRLEEMDNMRRTKARLMLDIRTYKERQLHELEKLKSNLSALPYMASIIADFDTRGIDLLARQLNWGHNIERANKVASINEIRKNAQELIAQYKVAYYQLEYLKTMFPAISDFIETDYNNVHEVTFDQIKDESRDTVRDYLSHEEYDQLSSTERNQLALDRYVESHHKSNWQIGRDYELYVGYEYQKKGYTVDFYGNNHGLNDLGRDLIAKKENKVLIIQCKYWSSTKEIHENHICQLYGTTICYCIEHNLPLGSVEGLLVTNIKLSQTADIFAKYLHITSVENLPMKDFPRIKCNINRNADGVTTKIYHLPFDQQYDACKINAPGEFFALTVEEAEKAGFRRAFKWYGS